MSVVQDWTNHWFLQPEGTVPTDVDHGAFDGVTDLTGALAVREASVSYLVPRDSVVTHDTGELSQPGHHQQAPMPDLDVAPDTALSQDLAALSRVILGIPSEAETPPVPGRVGGRARARRDVPVLVGASDEDDLARPRGKHTAAWAEDVADAEAGPSLDGSGRGQDDLTPISARVLDPAVEETRSWEAPAPFELEPEPIVEIESLRWAEAAELGASLGIELAAPAVEAADGPFTPDFLVEQTAPDSEPEPAPAPVVSWDTLATAPAKLSATPPPPRPSQSAASLLRDLSFLD